MRYSIYKYLIVPAFLFAFVCKQKVQEKEQLLVSNYGPAIDSAKVLVKNLAEKHHTPGVAISVSVDGEMVWTEGFGYSDLENRVSVDPSFTMFRIGSVSKTLTSTALGKLYDDGKIDFDNDVQEYVPFFPIKKYPITVRQVAGHTAGIRHYRGLEFLSDSYYPTIKEGLTIFENDTLLFEPDTKYSYSSYGWNLISAVVEGASGKPFLDYMEGIFGDLNMSNTMPDIAAEEIPGRTNFYMVENNSVRLAPYVDNSYKWAGGGFISTSEDLVKFGNAMLYNNYLSPESFETLTEPHYLVDSTSTHYGMGWSSGESNQGLAWVGHSGGSVGGITMFVIYPDEGIVVALCSNSGQHGWDGLHHTLASLFNSDL